MNRKYTNDQPFWHDYILSNEIVVSNLAQAKIIKFTYALISYKSRQVYLTLHIVQFSIHMWIQDAYYIYTFGF